MEHLDFVLWMILYPISNELVFFLYSKRNKNKNNELANALGQIINLAIWISVGIALFNN